MLKAIGFDLDNTLYDQKQFEYFAFWIIAEEVSKYYCVNKNNYFLLLKQLFNKNVHEYTFDKAIQLCIGKIPKDWESFAKKRLLSLYRSAKQKLKLFYWVEKFIKEAKKRGIKIVVITNGNAKIQKYKIDALGLRIFCDKIYISDELTPQTRKPDTTLFKYFLEDFNLKGKDLVYIGDNTKTDSSCQKLGIKFVHYGGTEEFIRTTWYAVNKG
jgi:putative hydrolase of the HAD superfamily